MPPPTFGFHQSLIHQMERHGYKRQQSHLDISENDRIDPYRLFPARAPGLFGLWRMGQDRVRWSHRGSHTATSIHTLFPRVWIEVIPGSDPTVPAEEQCGSCHQ